MNNLCQQFDNFVKIGKFVDRNDQLDSRRNLKFE